MGFFKDIDLSGSPHDTLYHIDRIEFPFRRFTHKSDKVHPLSDRRKCQLDSFELLKITRGELQKHPRLVVGLFLQLEVYSQRLLFCFPFLQYT